MLVQLALAGKLADAAGIVWGTCTECDPSRSGYEINLSMSELLDELLGDLGKPVFAGLVFGHTEGEGHDPARRRCGARRDREDVHDRRGRDDWSA